MSDRLLTEEIKISVLADHSAAGTTTVTGSALDMSGFDGAVILAAFGTANAGNYLKVAQAAESDRSDAADLEGSKITPSANNELVAQDIFRPTDRYLVPYAVRGASTLVSPIIAIQYKGHVFPVDSNSTGEIQVEQLVSPAEGTA